MQLNLFPYLLPMRPVRTARTVMARRRGWWLAVEVNKHVGLGEIAPWPGFGAGEAACEREMTAAGRARMAAWLRAAPWPDAADAPDVAQLGARIEQHREAHALGVPEVDAALEQALLDVWAQAHGLPLAQMLATPERASSEVIVHARIDSATGALDAIKRGARALKLKVGRDNLEDEGARVMAIRAAVGPDISLHLDANGAYPVRVACQAARLFAAASPAWLEQPVARDDIAGLAEVRRCGAVPVYADEAIGSAADAQALHEARAIDGVTLKPAFVGGPLAAVALGRWAQARGLGVCITDALETRVGRLGALHVALALGLDTPCGLAGAEMPEGPGPWQCEGHRLALPRAAGLGLSYAQQKELTTPLQRPAAEPLAPALPTQLGSASGGAR